MLLGLRYEGYERNVVQMWTATGVDFEIAIGMGTT